MKKNAKKENQSKGRNNITDWGFNLPDWGIDIPSWEVDLPSWDIDLPALDFDLPELDLPQIETISETELNNIIKAGNQRNSKANKPKKQK